MHKTRVLIADDHTIMRQGLRALLEKDSGLEVAGEAENGEAAVAFVRQHHPDVVLMDISMPVLNGIEATRQILAEFPQTKVVALSMNSDPQILESMLHVGAAGFLLKDCACNELTKAIHEVTRGEAYLGTGIVNHVIDEYIKHSRKHHPLERTGLTPAECNVLKLLAEGKSNKEMATILNISPKTVEIHRNHLMKKLNLHTVADLTRYAICMGLVSLSPKALEEDQPEYGADEFTNT